MQKRWNIELYDGENAFKARAYYLHGSGLWNVVLEVNGVLENALQTDDPGAEALTLIADAQSEAEDDAAEAKFVAECQAEAAAA